MSIRKPLLLVAVCAAAVLLGGLLAFLLTPPQHPADDGSAQPPHGGKPGPEAKPNGPAPKPADEKVTVVCRPRYYVVGGIPSDDSDEPCTLLRKPDPKQVWDVTGIVLEVVEPAEYAGQVLTMHHDGYLASGDAFKEWEVGKRYRFKVPRSSIGTFNFALCSVGGTRTVVGQR